MHGHGEMVRGQITGGPSVQGRLLYDGRRQGPDLYGNDDDDLRSQAASLKAKLIAECGQVAGMIYQHPSRWEMRIITTL